MGKLQHFFQRLRWEFRWMCISRQPRWLWYDIGENNWQPNIKEMILRGFYNLIIFLLSIEIMFYIAYHGLRTPFFDFVKNLSQLLGVNELAWLIYGLILGIAGSLLFGSISNHEKSVLSKLQTSFIYIIYFGVFILALNLFFLLFATTL